MLYCLLAVSLLYNNLHNDIHTPTYVPVVFLPSRHYFGDIEMKFCA